MGKHPVCHRVLVLSANVGRRSARPRAKRIRAVLRSAPADAISIASVILVAIGKKVLIDDVRRAAGGNSAARHLGGFGVRPINYGRSCGCGLQFKE